jgi:hypothetical protein
MTAKALLLKELCEAYQGEMSLHDGLENLTAEEAAWRMTETTWTIDALPDCVSNHEWSIIAFP